MEINPVRDLITDSEMDSYLLSIIEAKIVFEALTGFIKKHNNSEIGEEGKWDACLVVRI